MAMKDCSQKFSDQPFLVFIQKQKLLKWWFLCVFEIMWAPSALKLHLHPRVPVHVQWPSGFMERSLWRSLINISELNWRNTSKRVDIVLIFLLSDKLALTLHYSFTSSGNEELSFLKCLGRSIFKKKMIVLKVSSLNSSALVAWSVSWLWNSPQVFILCIIYSHSHDSQISPSSHTKNIALSTWRMSVCMLLCNVNYAAFSCMFWVYFFSFFSAEVPQGKKI